jgi:hypothetical protein
VVTCNIPEKSVSNIGSHEISISCVVFSHTRRDEDHDPGQPCLGLLTPKNLVFVAVFIKPRSQLLETIIFESFEAIDQFVAHFDRQIELP